MENEILLELKPSQWLNFGWFLLSIVGIFFIPLIGPIAFLPTLICIWKAIELSVWSYEFYEDMIIEKKGIFNVTTRQIPYYRIKSMMIEESFLYQLVGISKLHIKSSEQFTKDISLIGIDRGEQLMKTLTLIVNAHKEHHGTKEHDIFEL